MLMIGVLRRSSPSFSLRAASPTMPFSLPSLGLSSCFAREIPPTHVTREYRYSNARMRVAVNADPKLFSRSNLYQSVCLLGRETIVDFSASIITQARALARILLYRRKSQQLNFPFLKREISNKLRSQLRIPIARTIIQLHFGRSGPAALPLAGVESGRDIDSFLNLPYSHPSYICC